MVSSGVVEGGSAVVVGQTVTSFVQNGVSACMQQYGALEKHWVEPHDALNTQFLGLTVQ